MVSATAKSKISIGTTLATTDAASFALDTYKLIANVEDMGEAGSEAEIIVGKFVDQDYVRKLKGSRDNGTMAIVAGRDPFDDGQIALRAAEKSYHAYNFKVELNDAPAGGVNTRFYFKAIVASARTSMGGADDIVKDTFALAISGAMFEVPAGPLVTMTPAAGAITAGEEDSEYAGVTVAASGGNGNVSYAVTSGALPAGLTLNASTGEIAGTPTAAGAYTFTVTATYSGSGAASAAYTIIVSAD